LRYKSYIFSNCFFLKKKILSCLRAWQDVAIYPIDYISQLKNMFLGLIINKNLDNNSSNDGSEKLTSQNTNSNSNSNFISATYNDDDIDGKPLVDDFKKDDSNDIDGKPLNEDYDDDIDGKPC
jgi:hypothetical protein